MTKDAVVRSYRVLLRGREIDRLTCSFDERTFASRVSRESEVRDNLVRDDGYHPEIQVKEEVR